MATNPYFRKSIRTEQDLIDDLSVEVIKIHGFDMVYLPRTLVAKDEIFGEDRAISEFKTGREIEMLVESVDGFEGDGEVFGRLGLEIKDNISLLVARKRFEKEFSDLGFFTPREGDLLYFPISGSMFEINFVERENPFYQLNRISTYKVTCSLFQYNGEMFSTGWSVIDEMNTRYTEHPLDIVLTAGDGDFTEGEYVFQGSSFESATMIGRVEEWDPVSSVLQISNIKGTFDPMLSITGKTSQATYEVESSSESTTVITNEDFGDNLDIEEKGNEIFDFTELDPFSEGDL
jgi:hypothetical protein